MVDTKQLKALGGRGKECVISGCRREADENCILLGYHAANSGNPFPTFRDNLSSQGTDRLPRNVGEELSLLAAK